MNYILKGLIWAVLLPLSWYLGVLLLVDYVSWEMLLFFLIAHVLGKLTYRAFRWIDKHFPAGKE